MTDTIYSINRNPKYLFTTSLSWGGDTPTAELEDVVVRYTVSWGAPAQGPSYASGGQPADPDETEIVEIVSIDGTPWADYDYGYGGERHLRETIIDKILMDDDLYSEMLDEAREEDAAEYERAMERRWEEETGR